MLVPSLPTAKYPSSNGSISVTTLASVNLAKYYHTRNTVGPNGELLWPADVKIWPTKVMLSAGITSLVLALSVLISYAWGTEMANRVGKVRSIVGAGISVFKIAMFAFAGGAFLGANNPGQPGPQSLWTVTCNPSDQTSSLFRGTVNFGQFCSMQARLRLVKWLTSSIGS
jgi:hypothetical protein